MKDLVKIQKEIAKEVLAGLEIIDPTCILAGGAPRDWFFGKPATDLDFYIYDARCDLGQTAWMERLNKTLLDVKPLGLIEGKDPVDVDHEYTSMEHLRYVFEGTHLGMTVQVMVMSEPTYNCVVDNFCTDLSKAWWKGHNVVPTCEFLLAHATRTIKLCDNHNPSARYIKKIMAKFPTYVLETCDTCYSERVRKFKEEAGVERNNQLVKKWIDLADKGDRDGVSLPFWFS
jgi:hypothetical protein